MARVVQKAWQDPSPNEPSLVFAADVDTQFQQAEENGKPAGKPAAEELDCGFDHALISREDVQLGLSGIVV